MIQSDEKVIQQRSVIDAKLAKHNDATQKLLRKRENLITSEEKREYDDRHAQFEKEHPPGHGCPSCEEGRRYK